MIDSDVELSGSAPSNLAKKPKFTVVMCTFNGATYLRQQLESIALQHLPPDQVLISDDGSIDTTLSIVAAFQQAAANVEIQVSQGPGRGYAVNFLNALRLVDPETEFTALSDQDDVWFPDKLSRAAEMLSEVGEAPALYGASTLQCDENLETISVSRFPTVELGFLHALGQNFAGGNTMVFNNAALRIVQKALVPEFDVQVHDWWLYQIISGAGGHILFDEAPCMHYRQHSANQIGRADSTRAKVKRLKRMVRGDYRHWNTANLAALEKNRHLLTATNREALDTVLMRRDAQLLERLKIMREPGIYRQGFLGQIGLFAALALNRF